MLRPNTNDFTLRESFFVGASSYHRLLNAILQLVPTIPAFGSESSLPRGSEPRC
jgi:hypothetical protein